MSASWVELADIGEIKAVTLVDIYACASASPSQKDVICEQVKSAISRLNDYTFSIDTVDELKILERLYRSGIWGGNEVVVTEDQEYLIWPAYYNFPRPIFKLHPADRTQRSKELSPGGEPDNATELPLPRGRKDKASASQSSRQPRFSIAAAGSDYTSFNSESALGAILRGESSRDQASRQPKHRSALSKMNNFGSKLKRIAC